ncbi:hypothetical protein K488DRAFT_74530 [Vararia minispora EC-137]|uniref:Uncharacterized protein n=1 Tax=Vararia minispora EC-137 TaxID=1314806 RepID=A0ACB8Q6Z0_9AGAM|nr:hypothetical protein K488DRAFT_74530 [Vararia minispora EC-137]
MAMLDGLVGHHGRIGCRLYCDLVGRRKEGGSQYFPVCLKPGYSYAVEGCSHNDYPLPKKATEQLTSERHQDTISSRYQENLSYVFASQSKDQYKKWRLATGVFKPTVFSGVSRILGIPACFATDFMHLPALNISDLIALWRATLECDVGNNQASWDWTVLHEPKTWKQHGHLVAAASEKINSGYKAWEFLIYIYGFCPALLYGILPDVYWCNFCKLVLSIRILHQRVILKVELRLAHKWPIEHSIGNFGKQIRQPSNPFQNLAVHGIQRTCINALHAIYPQFADPSQSLRGSVDSASGYTLLHKLDNTYRPVQCCAGGTCLTEGCCEHQAFDIFWQDELGMAEKDATFGWSGEVKRWGRLSIPSGQIARSEWVERQESRIARCVKISTMRKDGKQEDIFASSPKTIAMVYLFGPPDANLIKKSLGVVCAMKYTGIAKVFDATAISSVVTLVPFPRDSMATADERQQSIPEGAGLGEQQR